MEPLKKFNHLRWPWSLGHVALAHTLKHWKKKQEQNTDLLVSGAGLQGFVQYGHVNKNPEKNADLDGGFKYFLFSPLFGEVFQFD